MAATQTHTPPKWQHRGHGAIAGTIKLEAAATIITTMTICYHFSLMPKDLRGEVMTTDGTDINRRQINNTPLSKSIDTWLTNISHVPFVVLVTVSV